MNTRLGILPPGGANFSQPCVVRDVLDRVGDQWSLLVLAHLGEQSMRFNALHRAIGDISKQVLSRTLRKLEEDGLVTRTVHASTPPRVDYALSAMGQSFLTPLKTLMDWADDHHLAILDARANFQATRTDD
ncbi:winged helix-turn-helix transcriptional regulator [Methylopila musalis]|uniref:Winged helix-turn-helix transcriptional regulator n=1 Tax=Methylopila musalis TaxID=1134781 RepID=A0ABW3Z2G2_9HYPH